MLSLREFSRLAGVSRTTVSRAFSGSDEIAESTREQIIALAREHDFRPSPVMQPGGIPRRTRSVGVLYPGFPISYYQHMAYGLQDGLLAHGYLPVMLAVRGDTFRRALNRLVDQRVDGLVVSFWEQGISPDECQHLTRQNLPVVCLCQVSRRHFAEADAVVTDDESGGIQAARHLLQLGHRRICVAASPIPNRDRVRTFTDEIKRAGYRTQPAPEVVICPAGGNAELCAKLPAFLRGPDRPTAIFTDVDLHAPVIYRVASECGLRVPGDLSVVGFADLDFSNFLDPPLTTVRQDGYALGRRATDFIVERIEGHKGPARCAVIPTELIARGSTGPAE